MSELTRRILFAIVAAPLAIAVIYVGGAALATLLAIIAAIAAWEFCRIARTGGSEPFDLFAIVAAACVPLVVYAAWLRLIAPALTHVAVLALGVFAATVFLRPAARRPLLAAAVTIFGVLYASMIAYVFAIRYHDYTVDAIGGTALVMLPILVTWATDVGAYFFGRLVGGRKLIPSVSPGKTVAGSLGGLAVAVVVAVVYVRLVLHPYAQLAMTTLGAIAFGAIVSVVAQIGDLAESLMKREAGVKDSGGLLPGHGGVLDRLDSLLFVLPVATLLLQSLLLPAPV